MQKITSTSNNIVKEIHSLHSKKGRDQSGLFLIEGEKYVSEALKSGLDIKYIALNDEARLDINSYEGLAPLYVLDEAPFKKACSTDSPSSVLAVAKKFTHNDQQIIDRLPPEALVIILEEIRDPGNLGTILRTACAAGINAIFVSSSSVDLFNPKVVRASAATLWKTPVLLFDSIDELSNSLKNKAFRLYSTLMNASRVYSEDLYQGRVAIMFGSEGCGLSNNYTSQATDSVAIPICAGVESLNLASSVAIILFEAKRQKEV